MPSMSTVLPLVYPANLRITSRGRVIINIISCKQLNPTDDIEPYISYLSPEYLDSLGKTNTYVESDIEKVS